MQQKTRSRWVAVNERGARIGEGHGRAVLSDHDVENLLALLDEREELIRQCRAVGMTQPAINRSLTKARLSYGLIAAAMEVSKSAVRFIALGTNRGQAPARWKKVED
jgi:urease accessory protein UreF